MKIFIPKILSFEGEQLTEKNLENFKKLVFKGWESKFTKVYVWDKLVGVSFYWEGSYIEVKVNQYFLFNTEDQKQYLIADELSYNSIKII